MGGLAAAFYPTNGRSAGIAWMYGVGRIGGILGPIAGGVLLRTASGTSAFYAIVMATALIAAAALWVKRRTGYRPSEQQEAGSIRSELTAE
jgi:AAHS family 4-hydroxybenzoate transporter-like MFS transporter